MRIVLLCLISSILCSCKHDVNVDIPPFEKKLVALSYVEEGDNSCLVYLNTTVDPQQSSYWKDADTSFAEASVIVTIDGIHYPLRRLEHFEPNRYRSAVTDGRFFVLEKKIESAVHLELSAEYKGMQIRSSCCIPHAPRIQHAILTSTLQSSRYDSRVALYLEADFPSEVSYYLVRFGYMGVNTFTGSKYFSELARAYIIASDGIRAKEIVFDRVMIPESLRKEPCTVLLSRIEKSHYDFALASRAQVGETDTFLPSETTAVPSNIVGGYGIFTAMSTDTIKVVMQ